MPGSTTSTAGLDNFDMEGLHMGMFDFITDIGDKLTGAEAREEKAREAAEAEVLEERMKGNALARHVIDLGLDVDGLRVSFDDGVATVHGEAADQATKERVILAIGNTQGVSQVDDRMTVAEPEPEATFYTVQAGDSLSKIAKEHYGDPMRHQEIFEANQPMLKDPDKIYPGQVLRIPASA